MEGISFRSYVDSYWNYYLLLEKRLVATEDYVAFDDANNKTFSIEYLTLLQATCSEIDVVGKAICKLFDASFNTNKAYFSKWGYTLQQHLPEILNQTVVLKNTKKIEPWDKWEITKKNNKKATVYYPPLDGNKTPEWWSAYNKVKHARTAIESNKKNYELANQRNVVLAMSALYSMHRIMMKRLNEDGYYHIERSKLFIMPEWQDDYVQPVYINSKGSIYYTPYNDIDMLCSN